ncbi:hypothetical protein CEH05_20070 [Halobacillus halophilus]|nr:hypothetical protein CEH05_20070 [Halobacillus halophilus]
MNCHGHQRRIDLVKNYNIVPITHTRLLNGHQLSSCTGRRLEDSYYSFHYENKKIVKIQVHFIAASRQERTL